MELFCTIPLKGGAETYDDISVDGNYLFALDARGDGVLSSFSIDSTGQAIYLNSKSGVPVEPYCGVSVRNGVIIVSGGTRYMAAYSYDTNGVISNEKSRLERDRGHPDVLLSDNGKFAFVSTHFGGPDFGVISVQITESSQKVISEIDIEGAGFTDGVLDYTGFPIKAGLKGDILYVAHGAGISVIKTSPEGVLTSLELVDVDFPCVNLFIQGENLFVIGNSPSNRIAKFDLTNPEAPKFINDTDLGTTGKLSSIVVTKDRILTLLGTAGVSDINLF